MKKIEAIVGLDLSLTSAGVARWPITEPDPKTSTVGIPPEFGSDMERYVESVTQLFNLIGKNDVVFMENYSYGSASNAVMAGELGGIVKFMILRKTGLKPIWVSPNTLKRFVLGAGKGQDKNKVILGAYKKWGIECDTDDEIDAYALCMLGKQLLHFDKPAYKYEIECNETVTLGSLENRKKKKKDRNANLPVLNRCYEILANKGSL